MKTECKQIYVETQGVYTKISSRGQLMTRKLRSMIRDGAITSVPARLAQELITIHYQDKKKIKKLERELEEAKKQLAIPEVDNSI